MKCAKHTRYRLQCNTDQYIAAVNNILGIKFCLAVELTSEGSVRLWALCSMTKLVACVFGSR